MNDAAYDILIVGGGPAGLAAALAASRKPGQRIAIVDDNPQPGGQIWRPAATGAAAAHNHPGRRWIDQARAAGVVFLNNTRVFAQPAPKIVLAEGPHGPLRLGYRRLIIATGARERFLPFPGWTLPNVVGAGGLQALAKAGWPIEGKRVVVAGSGPLLLAVAAGLRIMGADILLVAEQADLRSLAAFAPALARQPAKILQGLGYKRALIGTPYRAGCWPTAIEAQGGGAALVTLRQGAAAWTVECDYLACGFHLVPNLELPLLLGCAVAEGAVQVDALEETSVDGVYSAGEATGIGGVERALAEGRIAGYAASGLYEEAARCFGQRTRHRRFAERLERAFALRPELRELPQPDTIVCRCEDVALAQLRGHASWREAKLQTRCGMGPCQGRICGPAIAFLLGHPPDSVRPPITPVRIDALVTANRDNDQIPDR